MIETDWSAAVCASGDARELHLFFSDVPAEIAEAKQICGGCTLRVECLRGAVERREPWGVWGGHLFDQGEVIAVKRGRGRPRRADLERQRELRASLQLDLELDLERGVA
jgi:WhiB family transcriptional regulator, redox-sensing transcriptional regulator